MKEPWFSAHLMPGTNATEEFTFSNGTLDSLDDLVNTTIGIDAYLTDSYEDVASYSAPSRNGRPRQPRIGGHIRAHKTGPQE